jgi:uncharacterized protein with GYD domain
MIGNSQAYSRIDDRTMLRGGEQYKYQEKMGGIKEIPYFVVLTKFTKKGIENIKDSPNRLEDLKKYAKSLGGEIKHVYYTMGQYDAISVAEYPSDETCMQAVMAAGKSGFITTQTLRAFTAEEAAKIIEKL